MVWYVSSRSEHHHYGRGESGRRRHTSGTRTLSTISDTGDPASILGFDRSDEFLVSVCVCVCLTNILNEVL